MSRWCEGLAFQPRTDAPTQLTKKNNEHRLHGKEVMEKKRQNHALPEVRAATEQVLYDNPSVTVNTDDSVTVTPECAD